MKKLACAMLLLLSPFATAYDSAYSPFYLKFGYGSVDPDIHELDEYDYEQPAGYSLMLGYQASPFLALEGGYVNLGEITESYIEPYGYGTPGYDYYFEEGVYESGAGISASSLAIGVVLSTDVYSGFTAGVRFGYHLWDVEADAYEIDEWTEYFWNSAIGAYEAYDYGNEAGLSETVDGNDPYYGVTLGLGAGNWMFSADYTVYNMEDTAPALGSISVGFRF
ncbi:hypothetical protein ACNKU7_13905 [Microbulbifer sp. SA54]|uniref:hypothetical protein n=1 Tax=Microbulbifer sp. SA54 TaxID=3401577 RepID=UPI003AAEDD65